jgi:hypothetical protein
LATGRTLPLSQRVSGAAIDSAHALVVIGAYCVVFAVVAIALTWRRDVLE